ncbi:hypothetical protein BDN70DRAFT_822592 [Pholiota conissans]|uniref:BTB domain-containing protein n=1 Tax=Pholiota conissans TaxID=109636 RepID=A0A9P5ZDV2_9AGAR|nr:hypothetical protein BDN70DRAFT_822592 [Pholiota conissans]
MSILNPAGILLASPARTEVNLPSSPSDPPVADEDAPSTEATPSLSPRLEVRLNFDSEFYFRGALVVFQVEDHLFRVPTYIFAAESSHFVTLFNLPMQDSHEGAAPFTVALPTDVRWEDFRSLLKALYPISVETTLVLSETEWISVLKLSTQWYFTHLRQIAIAQLESQPSFTPLNKIVLGRECFISSWFLSGLTSIAKRQEPITDDDIFYIGSSTTIQLFRLRELIKTKSSQYHESTILEGLYSAFADEILSIKAKEARHSEMISIKEEISYDSAEASRLSSEPSSKKKMKKGGLQKLGGRTSFPGVMGW